MVLPGLCHHVAGKFNIRWKHIIFIYFILIISITLIIYIAH